MSVKIRLKRIGRKKQPSYRIVVSESRNPRGGKVIDTVGHYTPYKKDKPLELDLEKVEQWSAKGALPSDAVVKLLRRARAIANGTAPAKAEPKKKAKVEEPPAADVVETPAEDAKVEETPSEEAAPEESPVEETPAETEPAEESEEAETTEEPVD